MCEEGRGGGKKWIGFCVRICGETGIRRLCVERDTCLFISVYFVNFKLKFFFITLFQK